MHETPQVTRATENLPAGQTLRNDARADLLKMILRKEAERKSHSGSKSEPVYCKANGFEMRYGR